MIHMNKKNWEQVMKDAGSLWIHNGNPAKPHAELTSGKHSSGYNNGAKLVAKPAVLADVVAGMIENAKGYLHNEIPDVIMGPAMGAVTIGHEWARQLNTNFAFTEPVQNATDTKKEQVLKRFEIPKGARVLVVEDMVTTGGSIQKTIDTLQNLDVHIYPFVPIILDWSAGKPEALDSAYTLIPLIRATMSVWEPSSCELCNKGSRALRPKAHWNELNA